MRWAWMVGLVMVLGCAGKRSPVNVALEDTTSPASRPRSAPEADPDDDLQPPTAEPGGDLGKTKKQPLPTCGVTASYIAVADVQCADGTRPLDSDVPRGSDARRGNVGPNTDGHIIDLYEVTCPEGPKQVFVDMYDCEHAKPSWSELEVQFFVQKVLLVGNFTRFIERCLAEEARGKERVSLMIQTCLPAMPAALRLSGQRDAAGAWLKKYCDGTPPPTAEQPKRYKYLAGVIDAHLALAEHQGAAGSDSDRQRSALIGEYAGICGVDPEQFATWARDHQDD